MVSVVTGRDRECFGCRLVSGVGLVGIGAYIGSFARKNPTAMGKSVQATLAVGFSGLGVARIFNFPPFKHK